jgi:hypothetical protein
VSGDISQVEVNEISNTFLNRNIVLKVDMMICISALNNWRESVLRHAGPQIESGYKKLYSSSDEALLLNGGFTKARKIIFVPWQSEMQEQETR